MDCDHRGCSYWDYHDQYPLYEAILRLNPEAPGAQRVVCTHCIIEMDSWSWHVTTLRRVSG